MVVTRSQSRRLAALRRQYHGRPRPRAPLIQYWARSPARAHWRQRVANRRAQERVPFVYRRRRRVPAAAAVDIAQTLNNNNFAVEEPEEEAEEEGAPEAQVVLIPERPNEQQWWIIARQDLTYHTPVTGPNHNIEIPYYAHPTYVQDNRRPLWFTEPSNSITWFLNAIYQHFGQNFDPFARSYIINIAVYPGDNWEDRVFPRQDPNEPRLRRFIFFGRSRTLRQIRFRENYWFDLRELANEFVEAWEEWKGKKEEEYDLPQQDMGWSDFHIHIRPKREMGAIARCDSNIRKKLVNGMILESIRTTKSECFVGALCHLTGQSNNRHCKSLEFRRYLQLRQGLHLPIGCGVPISHTKSLAKFFSTNICIVDQWNVVIAEYTSPQWSATANLALVDGHIWIVRSKELAQAWKCPKCKRRDKEGPEEHNCLVKMNKCITCGVYYKKTHQCNDKHLDYLAKKKVKSRVVAKNIFSHYNTCAMSAVVFDFETFPEGEGDIHKVYAAGWLDCDTGTYHESWGQEALSKFIDWVLKTGEERGTSLKLVGYNNAGFDNHFIFRELLRRNITPSDFKLKGHDLIMLTHGEVFSCFDVYRFLPGSSLAAACKDFGAPAEFTKSHFPHRFVTDWNSLEYEGAAPGREHYFTDPPSDWEFPTSGWNCKRESLKYLKLDVLATHYLFEKLGSLFFDQFHINYTDFITLSHLSFELWANSVTSPFFSERTPEAELMRWKTLNPWKDREDEDYWIALPKEAEYRFIKRSVIGGMVYPVKQYFESEQHPDVVTGEATYDSVSHYICPLDVVSLYPHAMRAYPYPSGTPQWALQGSELLARYQTMVDAKKGDLLPLAVFECLYQPNESLIIPTIARRSFRHRHNGDVESDDKGTLSWDLLGGHGVFTSIDVLRMRDQGYSVTLVKALWWPKKTYLFKDYIELVKRVKDAGEASGNEALRNLGKILMNALYGKMLQMPILDDLLIPTTGEELDLWLESYDYTDLLSLSDDGSKWLYKGLAKSVSSYITKPCQLGAFVLSYSRLIMDKYRAAIDPYQLTPGAWEVSLLHSQYYGDTDSMHVEMWSTENEWGRQRAEALQAHIENRVLGKLWYDLKGQEKVIRAIYLAPKTYIMECLTKDNKIVYKKKAKGIRSDKLTWNDYQEALETGVGKELVHESIKRVAATAGDKRLPFEVLKQLMRRKLLKEKWNGRKIVKDKMTVPLGFVH